VAAVEEQNALKKMLYKMGDLLSLVDKIIAD
jgi:hypothetical protein